RKGDNIRTDRCVQLFEQFLSAAIPMPGEQHVGVHRIAGPGAPQCQRGLLAIVIDQHSMSAIERTLGYRIEQTEGWNHRTCRKNLDLEVATGHIVDLLRVIERIFVEDVLCRPCALKAHADGTLCVDDGGRGNCGGAGGCNFQETSTGRGIVLRSYGHGILPDWPSNKSVAL